MKLIKKRNEPQRLRSWKKTTDVFPDASFDTHQFPKEEVKTALVEEQGGLCAYTMIRIVSGGSHIEHLKPRSVSKSEGKLYETTDYSNLVACYPNTGLATTPACPYGADSRGDIWDEGLFITPLNGTCESRFKYRIDGKVEVDDSDEAAKWTRDALSLDHPELADLRRQAILGLGLSPMAENPVNAREARDIADTICELKRNRFAPFCVAIKHAAIAYKAMLEKAQRKHKFAARSKAKKKS